MEREVINETLDIKAGDTVYWYYDLTGSIGCAVAGDELSAWEVNNLCYSGNISKDIEKIKKIRDVRLSYVKIINKARELEPECKSHDESSAHISLMDNKPCVGLHSDRLAGGYKLEFKHEWIADMILKDMKHECEIILKSSKYLETYPNVAKQDAK